MAPESRSPLIGAGLSTAGDATDAAREASRTASTRLAGRRPDLAFVFLSAHHLADAPEAADAVLEELRPENLIGCVGEGVVAGGQELEDAPAVAVWAGSLPDAEIECFHAVARDTEGGISVAGWPELDDPALVTLLVDPFTFPAAPFLAQLNEERPGLPIVGGIAAGAGRRGGQALILDDEVHDEGAVGAALSGVAIRTVVSQGCAPIGRDAVITDADGNLVRELAGRPALDRLRSEVATLSAGERELASRGILAGLVIDENRSEYRRGDYLMRGVLGVHEESGSLAVGDAVRVGQTLRFHVRDAASADEDLREALAGLPAERPAGALLFTCNGRGTNLFLEPDHDAALVREVLGTDAVAGLFCAGEIGPVGGRTFLHGFTATLAVFLES